MLHTIFWPVLLNGADLGCLITNEEIQLILFGNKFVRIIFSPVKDNYKLRIQHSEEIKILHGQHDIFVHVKARSLRWACLEGRFQKKVGVEQPGGRRLPGIPRRRWWDNTLADIERLGATVENEPAKDMEDECWWDQIIVRSWKAMGGSK